MIDFAHRSIEIILANQSPSGAYIASPNFESYRYCWLRDGSFTAHAMDQWGQTTSSAQYFRWVSRVIRKHASKVGRLEAHRSANQAIDSNDFLHTRYTLEGDEAYDQVWGNFQIDGYGTWLWALAEHQRMSPDPALLQECAEAVRLTIRYLQAVWDVPNYDCWEENPQYLHVSTLGAVYGGLSAALVLAAEGVGGIDRETVINTCRSIKRFILDHGVAEDRLAKHIIPSVNGSSPRAMDAMGVDASQIGLVTPYGLFKADEPRMACTWEAIKQTLIRPGGGVYRYKADTYFGGGEWVLLAGWAGWHAALNGERRLAEELLAWIEAQADPEGHLPEQVSAHLLAPEYYEPWRLRWGTVASPLLWSHAMYMILLKACQG